MKKGEVKKEEEKPVTVVEKWNRDIEGMKETAKNFREQSIKRANMRMEAFRNSFTNDIKRIETTIGNLRKEAKAFMGQCHKDMGSMRATVVKMQAKTNDYKAKFKNNINGMRDTVKGMAIHIWGTTA